MGKYHILKYILILLLFSTPFWAATRPYIVDPVIVQYTGDSIILPQTIDTALINPQRDSINIYSDSLQADTIGKPKKKSALDATVDYTAEDSIVFTAGNWGYLHGASQVFYTDLKLKAENIILNMDSSIVTASFGLDSIGEEFGYPTFTQGGTDYESKWMKYNFRTQKGFTRHSITQQGEGYVVADRAKKNPDQSFFMTDGTYTTCDEHDHPHFYIKMTKAKVVPGKNVVTGPAYLVIEDLPIPFLGLPFGFFPFTDSYSSGVIMPSFGDDMDKGFFLHDGGYYFAISDYMDLAVTGEIYTKGSWALNARSTYRKRYKYNGSFDLGYQVTKLGEKGVDASVLKDTKINWTHSQDPKANMYRTLSASVQFATSSYDRNQLNSLGTSAYTNNTRSSSVNLTQRIPNSPWSISTSMNINQITRDSTISLTLPDMSITMSRIYPFKRKEMIGDERWYEKIYMSYTGNIRNSITTKENLLFESDLRKDWRNGVKHSIPIGATFSALNYLNITPSINYTERWYTQKITQRWDKEKGRHVAADTTNAFHRIYDFNFNLSFQTKMYGMYLPVVSPTIAGYKIDRIRHVFTPSVTYQYSPDFSDPMFGAYSQYGYYDENNEYKQYIYSPYSSAIFGTAPTGKQSSLNFSFENNLEMKYRTPEDSLKKASLIDNFGLNFGYNLAADSFKLSNINANIRLKLSKSLTVNLNAVFDPYLYDPIRNTDGDVTGLRIKDELRMSNGKGIGRLMSTGYSISPSIDQDTFKKWFGKSDGKSDKDSKDKNTEDDEDSEDKPRGSLFAKKEETGEYDSDGYLKNDVNWNLGFSYSMNYGYNRGRIDLKNYEYKRDLTHNLSVNGSIQPTKNWNFQFSASYDFEKKKIAYSTFSLMRNLHCWSISANFNPMGQGKFFYVKLSASSQLLQDLKYEERGRSSSRDPEWQ